MKLALIAMAAYSGAAWYDCYVIDAPTFTPAVIETRVTDGLTHSMTVTVKNGGLICGPVAQTIDGKTTIVIKDGECFGSQSLCGKSMHCIISRLHIEPEEGPSQERLFGADPYGKSQL